MYISEEAKLVCLSHFARFLRRNYLAYPLSLHHNFNFPSLYTFLPNQLSGQFCTTLYWIVFSQLLNLVATSTQLH